MNWQPIETAPKDGTDILIWDGYDTYIAGWGYDAEYWKADDVECWCIKDSRHDGWWCQVTNATHWMTLPEPPKQEGG